ncbi:MAG: antibiotic biosynthesis monooxygenase [Fimbriimonadaceae bacterium]|nr:antibiotic biosynthesis monooxygenase [Fimbriimonadaceae bacterium]QYK55557.1 MAG: antibiotic biosynthesis monooxygenase [Fimbriimonadaceae bacterium]
MPQFWRVLPLSSRLQGGPSTMDAVIILTAYSHLRAGTEQTAFELSRANKARALTEAGCLKFDYYTSVEDPLKIVFVEEWESMDALNAHFEGPAFKGFFDGFVACLEAPPEIRIFEATKLED